MVYIIFYPTAMKNLELTHIFSGGIGALLLVLATLFLGPGPSCAQSDDQERERLRLESVRKHLYGEMSPYNSLLFARNDGLTQSLAILHGGVATE